MIVHVLVSNAAYVLSVVFEPTLLITLEQECAVARVREFADDVQVDVAPPEYSPPPLGISSISLEEMSRLRTLSTPGSRIEAVLSGMEHLVQARDMFRRAREDPTLSLLSFYS